MKGLKYTMPVMPNCRMAYSTLTYQIFQSAAACPAHRVSYAASFLNGTQRVTCRGSKQHMLSGKAAQGHTPGDQGMWDVSSAGI
jgi:hypothetical protein